LACQQRRYLSEKIKVCSSNCEFLNAVKCKV
jgi:hypothetical protein